MASDLGDIPDCLDTAVNVAIEKRASLLYFVELGAGVCISKQLICIFHHCGTFLYFQITGESEKHF